jgi:hypothetical protein
MKAEGLRLGNYVYYGVVNEVGDDSLEWGELTYHALGILIHGLHKLKEKINPIEIDEYWLEKFGFHYAPDCLIYGKSGWFKKIEYQDDPTYFFFNNHLQGSIFLSSEKSSFIHFIDSQMIYVHQLQNLYFSLTGQELTIK